MRLPRLLFLAATIAGAHDLYILPAHFVTNPGQALTTGLHNGDSFPNSEVSPAMERLRDVSLVSARGSSPLNGLKVDGKRGVATFNAPASGEYILALRTIPNFIELKAPEFLAYLKEEGLQHVIDWRASHGESAKPGRERYSKHAKALLVTGKSDGFFNHEIGHVLEIVPERDPYQSHAGDNLPIRILFRGRPAAGIQVEVAWSSGGQSKETIAGRTGADGRVIARLEKPGLYRIHSLKMERCAEPAAADWESSWASFTFELR